MAGIQYRQLDAPEQLNTNVPDNGAASAYRSLAGAFKDFSDTGFNIGDKLQAKAGEEAGIAAGSSGKAPVEKSPLAEMMTPYGHAYNTAAEATYIAKTHIDAASTLAQIEQETGGDLPTYQARADAYVSQLQKSMPANYWNKISPMIQGRATAGALKVHAEQIHQQGEESYDSLMKSEPAMVGMVTKAYTVSPEAGDQAMASALSDHDAQLEAFMRGPHPVLDATGVEKRRTAFTNQLHSAIAQERVSSIVDPAMTAAQANVDQGDQMMEDTLKDEKIPIEVRAAAAEDYRKKRELQSFLGARTHTPEANALAQNVAAGGYGPALEDSARTLYRQAAIGPEEFSTKLAEMTRNQEKGAADRAAMAAVDDALANDKGLDPKNTEQSKAVDIKFQSLTNQAGVQPGDERWVNAAATMVTHLNILPASAESWVRIGLMSGDPVRASLAASAYARFRDANPTAAVFAADPKINALAETINSNMSSGMQPAAAYTLAMNTVNVPPDQKEVYHRQYTTGNFAQNNADWLHSNVLRKSEDINPGILPNTPDTPIALQAEFEQQVRQYFDITGGNIDKARKLAGDAVVRNGLWGRTDVNGQPEIMKYGSVLPPTPILRADIADKVKGIAVESPDGHGTSAPVDPATVKLVPNPMTDRTQGQHWSLQTVDQYGAPETILDPRTNRPLDYALPNNTAAFARKQQEENLKASAAAKADREQYLSIHPADLTNMELRRARQTGGQL